MRSKTPLQAAPESLRRLSGSGCTRGLDSFMSDEQFKKFYWPSLRRYLTEVAEAGLTPVVYVRVLTIPVLNT